MFREAIPITLYVQFNCATLALHTFYQFVQRWGELGQLLGCTQGANRAAHILQRFTCQAFRIDDSPVCLLWLLVTEYKGLLELNVNDGQVVAKRVVNVASKSIALSGGCQIRNLPGILLLLPVRYF